MCEVYATNKWVSPAASTDTEAEEAGPSTSTPSGSVPSGSVPSGSVPSGSVPSGSVPSGSVPSGSVPSGSVPSGSVPGSVHYVEQLLTMKVYKYVLLYHPCRMSVSKTPNGAHVYICVPVSSVMRSRTPSNVLQGKPDLSVVKRGAAEGVFVVIAEVSSTGLLCAVFGMLVISSDLMPF